MSISKQWMRSSAPTAWIWCRMRWTPSPFAHSAIHPTSMATWLTVTARRPAQPERIAPQVCSIRQPPVAWLYYPGHGMAQNVVQGSRPGPAFAIRDSRMWNGCHGAEASRPVCCPQDCGSAGQRIRVSLSYSSLLSPPESVCRLFFACLKTRGLFGPDLSRQLRSAPPFRARSATPGPSAYALYR